MQRPDLGAAEPRRGRAAAHHLPQEQADPARSGTPGPAAQAQHPRRHGDRGVTAQPGQGHRHRRGPAERGGREAQPHKVPPETRPGRARAGAAGCGDGQERGHGPTARCGLSEGWGLSCKDSLFSFCMRGLNCTAGNVLDSPESQAGSGGRGGFVRPRYFLPLASPAPAPPLACLSGFRHFVLQEELELLRSDVWLRCEIFVKGHVAEIDFKTGLFRLKVVLLDLCKSSGVSFRIICGRLKLS